MRGRTAVALLAALMLLAGCSLQREAKHIPPKASTDTSPDQGPIGTPITIRGGELQYAVEARVTALHDPVSASPADATNQQGARFAGVEISLRNIGERAYSESPLQDSALLLAGGGKADPVNLLGGPCGGRFPLQLRLRPGQSAGGCLPFEVPPGARPSQFTFALDSGFGPEKGTWELR
jgi:hypothetical protein